VWQHDIESDRLGTHPDTLVAHSGAGIAFGIPHANGLADPCRNRVPDSRGHPL
jgi:hypothetical protein